jgi:hypothetical protein
VLSDIRHEAIKFEAHVGVLRIATDGRDSPLSPVRDLADVTSQSEVRLGRFADEVARVCDSREFARIRFQREALGRRSDGGGTPKSDP